MFLLGLEIFYRDKNVLSEMMNEKSTSKIREIVELTRILREMAESQVKDEKGNILIRPGLKVRHKKSGLEYTVRDVQDDKDKIKIVLNVPELPRVQPGKTLPSVVTEKDDPKSIDLPQISNDLDLEKISNEEQTIFVIDEKEFEKRYEVK